MGIALKTQRFRWASWVGIAGLLLGGFCLYADEPAPVRMPPLWQMAGIARQDPEVPPGEIWVRVVRAQMSERVVGTVVLLNRLDQSAPQQQRITDSEGQSRFSSLAPGVYEVHVEGKRPSRPIQVQAAPSPGMRLLLQSFPPAEPLRLEALQVKPIIAIQQGLEQDVQLVESFSVVNTHATPMEPPPDGLVFALPAHAKNAQTFPTLSSAPEARLSVVPATDSAGAYLRWEGAIPPGEHEVVVGFLLPYADGRMQFQQTATLAWQQTVVVFPQRLGLTLRGDAFSGHSASMGTTALWHMETPPVPAGQIVQFVLSGLPRESPWPRRIVGGACVGLLLGFLVVGFLLSSRTRSSSPDRAELYAQRDTLLQKLVQLEQHMPVDEEQRVQVRAQLATLYEQLEQQS